MSSKSIGENYYRPEQKLDDDLQRELDEALGDSSLEDILAAEESATSQSTGTAGTGEGVKAGTVVSIERDAIFVDMGGRSEGILPVDQFADEPLPEIGSRVEVTIEGYNGNEGLLKLSRKGAVLAAAWETLEEGQVVEGRVTGHNKGGLELDVQGMRAFMPISQIERFRVDDLAQYDNQKMQCVVSEVDRAENNIVLSRRDLLEIEAEQQREKLFESLKEGQVIGGIVRTIMPYGAFVDIGGADGLVHVSDMSHSRVEDPASVLKEGQKVEVMILKIDRENRKIGLGLKQVQEDPWSTVVDDFQVDTLVTGRVTKLMEFGAFVELKPGIEGLVPISEMTFERRIKHPSEIVAEGDMAKVRVLNVDGEKRRISLSIKRVGDDPWTGASVRWAAESVVTGIVTRLTDFGAFVELAGGVEGLIHVSELSDEHVRTPSDVVRDGQSVSVKVLEVDEQRRRISLSLKQAVSTEGSLIDFSEGTFESKPRKRNKPLKGGLD